MEGIKNIIFDLGGVIINLDNRLTEDAFVLLGAKPFREYFGHGHAASFFSDYEVGKIGDRQFIKELKELTGIDAPDQEIVLAWNALLLDFPPARMQLLKEVGKRYRIFLFSNTNAMHLAALRQIYFDAFGDDGLDTHFEKAYYSHILGLRKPDTESYRQILLDNGLKASETLFVDDAAVNIDGAKAAGLQGLFLKPGVSITDLEW